MSEDNELLARYKAVVEKKDGGLLRSFMEEHREARIYLDRPLFSFAAPAIVWAASIQDRELVLALLDVGADLNRKSDWDMGPFGVLHHLDDKELANELIERGAIVDIHAAAHLGMLERVTEMVAADPRLVHQRGPDGQYPLHMADTVEIAAFLLQEGADLEALDMDHISTPLQWQATRRPEVARYLVAAGAKQDIFALCFLGDEQLLRDFLKEHPEAIYHRINHPPFEPKGELYKIYTFTIGGEATPLHALAESGQAHLLPILLEAGLEIDVRGDYDEATPLHMAVWNNEVEVVKELLSCGADHTVLSGKIHQSSPLVWAVVAGRVEPVRLLLAAGAEREAQAMKAAEDGVIGVYDSYSNGTKADRRAVLELMSG